MSSFELKPLITVLSTDMVPSVQVSMPPSIFSTVVLPAPDGPTIMQNSPLAIEKLIWSMAFMTIWPI